MEINILKCHGSGNDFILIDEIERPLSLSDGDRARLAILLCDRSGELGADGILFVQKGEGELVGVRIFNSDGSEASMCGNGLRCTARYASEKLDVKEVTFETLGGLIHTYQTPSFFEGIQTYCVEIKPIYFDVGKLPMVWDEDELINQVIGYFDGEIRFTAIAIPNPHLIAIVDDMVSFEKQEAIARKANSLNPHFPDGVNVSFVKVIEEGKIYVRTYERGAGFTNACGTAMSASSLITKMLGHHGELTEVNVYNDGGFVRCVVGEDDKVSLIGNATYEFTATVGCDLVAGCFEVLEKELDVADGERYAALQTEAALFLEGELFG